VIGTNSRHNKSSKAETLQKHKTKKSTAKTGFLEKITKTAQNKQEAAKKQKNNKNQFIVTS